MKKKIGIIYSTNNNDEFIEEYNESLTTTCSIGSKNIIIYPIVNHNEYSLSEAYNRGIKYFEENYNISEFILTFIHHDISFDTPNWGKILLKHFNKPNNNYQILGMAGTPILPESGMWWKNRSNMIGIVNHDNSIRKWESKYSEPHFGIKPVSIVDGVFIAVDTENIEHMFDENYKGFHFYDISFVFKNVLDGCNAGVITDIRITHKSIGQTNEKWELNRQQFAEEYKDELPFNINKKL